LNAGEKPEETLFRELSEEIGLVSADVRILGRTRDWLRYKIPERMVRDSNPVCIGQKQVWFLLLLKSPDAAIQLNHVVAKPEFDDWMWVTYWYPLRQVVRFKREVYRRALKELAPYLSPGPKPWRAKPLDTLWGDELGHEFQERHQSSVGIDSARGHTTTSQTSPTSAISPGMDEEISDEG